MAEAMLESVPFAGRVFGADAPHGVGGLGGSDAGPLTEVHVFWLAGMSCDGCSIAVTGATAPSVEELLGGRIPGLPRVVLHHPVLSIDAGHDFIKPFANAVAGKLGAPYVVVLEGSVPDDQAFAEEGYFSGLGVGADWPEEAAPAPRAPDQEYCLDCGLRLPPAKGSIPSLRRRWLESFAWYPGDWFWPALLVLVVAALGAAGAIALARHGEPTGGTTFAAPAPPRPSPA